MIKISPSLLAADMGDLRNDLAKIEASGVPYIHLDIMDGEFVPNISYGPAVVKALRANSNLIFDVHLMVQHPDKFIEPFRMAGADIITLHAESTCDLVRTMRGIRALGMKAGVAINPATPLSFIEDILEEVDMILLMSVVPGFGGQKFMPEVLTKITELRTMINELGLDIDIEVDGGIGMENVLSVVEAGANVIVSGTGIFGKEDITKGASDMADLCNDR